jgi:hypothetical protein
MKVLNPFNNVQHSHELDVSYLIMVYWMMMSVF